MSDANNLDKKGIFFAFLTAAISGVAIFYSKIAVAKLEPLMLATLRNSFVGILFLTIILLSSQRKKILQLEKWQLIKLVLIGFVGGGIPFYLFFTGLKLTSSITANIIHKTLFIWVAFLSYIFLREKFRKIYLPGFLMVLGANIVVAGLPKDLGKGELFIFLATLFWSIENVISKKALATVSADIVALFRMGIGAVILLAINLATGKGGSLFTIKQEILPVVIIGATILFFYNFFWYRALKLIPATLATFILSFSVVFGNILNGSFAGLKLSMADFYTTFLIGIGVVLVVWQSLSWKTIANS